MNFSTVEAPLTEFAAAPPLRQFQNARKAELCRAHLRREEKDRYFPCFPSVLGGDCWSVGLGALGRLWWFKKGGER